MGGYTPGGVFLVCAANMCRSVYGSAILADALSGKSIPVASAGVDAAEGTPPCQAVRRLIGSAGLPEPAQLTSGARELDVSELAGAALIITFTTRQRGLVARLVPSSRDRLFTLLEASNLAATTSAKRLDPGDLQEWVERLHLNRPTLALLPEAVDPRPRGWWHFSRHKPEVYEPWDIPDAHSLPDGAHLDRLSKVAQHCRQLGTILAGANA